MSHILSRLSLPDYALVGGCLALLALMTLVGPGAFRASEPAKPHRPGPLHRGSGFWDSWPGALVATVGCGALLYMALALFVATR